MPDIQWPSFAAKEKREGDRHVEISDENLVLLKIHCYNRSAVNSDCSIKRDSPFLK